jgi:hypothetical protein
LVILDQDGDELTHLHAKDSASDGLRGGPQDGGREADGKVGGRHPVRGGLIGDKGKELEKELDHATVRLWDGADDVQDPCDEYISVIRKKGSAVLIEKPKEGVVPFVSEKRFGEMRKERLEDPSVVMWPIGVLLLFRGVCPLARVEQRHDFIHLTLGPGDAKDAFHRHRGKKLNHELLWGEGGKKEKITMHQWGKAFLEDARDGAALYQEELREMPIEDHLVAHHL